MTKRPLSDINILELSTMIAGPYAGQLLGDLGADVVKIERPAGGELARDLEPKIGDQSFYYLTANRNKRSLALDVTADRGRELFFDLVEKSDVVLVNFPPSFTERYGIDYDAVSERNPDIVYCGISAYGSSGPYRDDPGIDTTVQALSGGMSMTRTEETKPMRSGVPMNDVFASLHAVSGIVTALFDRERNGDGGEFVDVSLLDAGIAGLTTRATYSMATEEPYPPFGRRHNYFAPEGVYEVADGDVQLSVVTDRHWQRFCDAIDAPALAERDRFATSNDRVQHRAELESELEALLGEHSVDELVETLRDAGIPAAPVNDTVSVWEEPQVRARDMRRTFEHPTAGEVDTLGFPVKYDDIEPSIERPPPRLGEHTEEILRAGDVDEETIAELLDAGIVDGIE